MNSKVLDYSGSYRFLFYNSHHAKVRLIIAADVIACFPLFIVVEEQRITSKCMQIHCHFSRKFLLRSSCTIYYISQFTFSGVNERLGPYGEVVTVMHSSNKCIASQKSLINLVAFAFLSNCSVYTCTLST